MLYMIAILLLLPMLVLIVLCNRNDFADYAPGADKAATDDGGYVVVDVDVMLLMCCLRVCVSPSSRVCYFLVWSFCS